MNRLQGKPAIVVAIVALVLSGTGTAFAGKMITGKKIKDDSVTGADIKDGSLTADDLEGDFTGPRGPEGPQGPQGQQGIQGIQGPSGLSSLERVQKDQNIPATAGTQVSVSCPAGKVPIAGGYEAIGSPMQIKGELPTATSGSQMNAWMVSVFNNNGTQQTLRVYAICATVQGGFPVPQAP
jgi:hypothetical protein